MLKLALAAILAILLMCGAVIAGTVAWQAAVSAYHYGDGHLACVQFLVFGGACLWSLACLIEWMVAR